MNKIRQRVVTATIGLLAISAVTPPALASPGAGLTIQTLATAHLDHPVNLHADGIKLRTKDSTIVRVQNIVFAPGAVTGWHHHPGMVLVAVASGSVTVWDSDCTSTTYGPASPAGAAFTESGDEALQVTSAQGASVYATYVVPNVDPPQFRIEADAPACP